MTVSMTGFAARRGAGAGHAWSWDIRSVNGKGLDLRLRVPDWIDGLEVALRAELQKAMGRGNVSLSLRVAREGGDVQALRVNEAVLGALEMVQRRVYVEPAVPLKVVARLEALAKEPPVPLSMLHIPVPTAGESAARVTVVRPQVAAPV